MLFLPPWPFLQVGDAGCVNVPGLREQEHPLWRIRDGFGSLSQASGDKFGGCEGVDLEGFIMFCTTQLMSGAEPSAKTDTRKVLTLQVLENVDDRGLGEQDPLTHRLTCPYLLNPKPIDLILEIGTHRIHRPLGAGPFFLSSFTVLILSISLSLSLSLTLTITAVFLQVLTYLLYQYLPQVPPSPCFPV